MEKNRGKNLKQQNDIEFTETIQNQSIKYPNKIRPGVINLKSTTK